MVAGETGSAARKASVSGINGQTIAAPSKPPPTSVKKTERQPKPVCSTPPTSGASTGASAITAPISDNSRPARAPEYRSRTMARASTMPPEPPSACSARAAISISIEVESAQARLAAQ